jgi:hypothetical protein
MVVFGSALKNAFAKKTESQVERETAFFKIAP